MNWLGNMNSGYRQSENTRLEKTRDAFAYHSATKYLLVKNFKHDNASDSSLKSLLVSICKLIFHMRYCHYAI